MRGSAAALLVTLLLLFAACSGRGEEGADTSTADSPMVLDTLASDSAPADSSDAADEHGGEVGEAVPPAFVAVTFNTGTGGGAPAEGNDGYNEEQAFYNDEYYGNGIAWKPFVEKTRLWFAEVDPDVVVFQEIFWPGECPLIPEEAWVGFVCEDWDESRPSVMEQLLGTDYQYMCNPGKPDKCAAVHKRFGAFRGCADPVCLEGMDGYGVEDCGKGARIGRATIDLVNGGTLTLVNIHGSSGLTDKDMACRKKQFEQVFVDLGDGEPGVNGEWNLAMGDLNTDPGTLAEVDVSAATFNEFVGPGKEFSCITELGPDAPGTYGPLNIDHVVSDRLVGECWHPTVTAGHGPVMGSFFFDHLPAVCTLHAP